MLDFIFNNIFGNISAVIVSLLLLYYGAEFLVKGSVNLAVSFGVQKLIVGITIVAFGTSMPEFTVSLIAKIKNSPNIAIGNIIGSNIANIAFILGVASLIRPLQVNLTLIKIEVPVLLGATLIFNFLSLDGKLNVFDGVFLITIFLSYMVFRVIYEKKKYGKSEEKSAETSDKKIKNYIFVILGIITLVFASELLIKSSVFIAKKAGINELIIGLTLVAVGTSLPELFTSVVASVKGEADISIGNVVGSNFFNIFFILGFIAILGNLKIEPNIYKFDNWVNLGLTVLLLPVMITGFKVSRIEGIVFLVIYISYVLNLYFKWIYFY